jgi:hypothetical protein
MREGKGAIKLQDAFLTIVVLGRRTDKEVLIRNPYFNVNNSLVSEPVFDPIQVEI